MINIKKIILEEIGDFDWTKSSHNPYRMDTSRDYMGVWPRFEEMLSELDIPYIEGEIEGDDYAGRTWMRIRTLYFEFDVSIRFEYDQTIESGTVFWSIADPNEDSDGSFSGEHSLVGYDYLQPIVDKFREMVEPLVEKRKHEPWGHLSESSDLRVIDTPDTVSVYKNGGVCDISHMGNGVWEVNRVFTKEGTRGGGLGSELLTTALNKVLEKDPASIYVTPYGYGSDPEELYVFYGKNGFVMDDEQYGLMWYEKQNLNEDFDWVQDQLEFDPLNPKTWVGKTFGYGEELKSTLNDYERDELWYVEGLDIVSDYLGDTPRVHIRRTSSGHNDMSTSITVNSMRRNLGDGTWVWINT